jgi:hypothetical protein
MKRLLPLLLLVPSFAFGGDKNKPIDLTGSWKETRRMDLNKQAIPFTDTVRMKFMVGNEYLWMKPNTFQYRGTYKANAASLDLGMRAFTALEMTPSRMVLKDELGIYEFSRYKEMPAQEDNAAATNGDRAKMEESYDGVKDIGKLTGKWEVYKRTSAVQMSNIDYNRILKIVKISAKPLADSLGGVYAATDRENAPSWYVKKFENSTLFCGGKDSRELKVLKCDGKELVIQEGNVTYFFKQF